MKWTLGLIPVLLLFAATDMFAQETTSSQNYGTVPSTATAESAVKTLKLSEAYPLANTLLNQNIALSGTANRTLNMPVGIWIFLVDGSSKIVVVKKFSTLVPTTVNGKQVKLFGMFTLNDQKQLVFSATGIKVLTVTTTQPSKPIRR